MNVESIISQGWYAISNSQNSVIVSLYQSISDVIIDFGANAYFGMSLQQIEPGLTRVFIAFEDLSKQYISIPASYVGT